LPFTALEAGAAGLAVVTTRVGGLPELVKDGHSGIVVEPKNAKDIAKAIKTLSEDPVLRVKYGAKINELVRTEYSAKTMLEKTIQTYN
jgi:glycosyltransferase involved in cell wall biosynthesis